MGESAESLECNSNQPTELQTDIVQSAGDLTMLEAAWAGPLPPPNALQRYNEIIPGAANRILKMAEEGSRQRHSQESVALETARTVIVGDFRISYLGLAPGFIISLVGMGGSIYLIAGGHDWAGLALGGIDLTALVGVFVYGAQSRRADRNRRNSEPAQFRKGLSRSLQ